MTTDLRRRRVLQTIVGLTGVVALPGSAQQTRVVSVRDFGARGDGRTDDTTAFRQALGTGADVFVPATAASYRVRRTLALARAGQRLFGEGAASKVMQMGAGADADAFIATADGCSFDGLHLVPGTNTSALANGWGIVVARARLCTIENCLVTGMRRGGILLADADDCRVIGNTFRDSVVRGGDVELQSQTGYDIFLMGSSSRNLVSQNRCESGVGVGIGCQTAARGKSQDSNTISGNTVSGQPGYGIMVYRSEPGDHIHNTVIHNNTVSAISGAIRSDGRTRFYGCGIYVASANNFTVTDNRVTGTNTDRRLPFSGSAVPAGIGVSGYGNGAILRNVIDRCYDGIASIQTSAPESPADHTEIADNIVRGCDHTGILLLDSVGATVVRNQLSGAARSAQGIYAARAVAAHRGRLQISGNQIEGFGVGVEVREGLPFAEIADNVVRGNSGHAIFGAADELAIRRNRASGIVIAPSAQKGLASDNVLGGRGIQDGTRGRVRLSGNRPG